MTRKQIYLFCLTAWILWVGITTDILFSTHHLAEVIAGEPVPLSQMSGLWWWSAFKLYLIGTLLVGAALYALLWIEGDSIKKDLVIEK